MLSTVLRGSSSVATVRQELTPPMNNLILDDQLADLLNQQHYEPGSGVYVVNMVR